MVTFLTGCAVGVFLAVVGLAVFSVIKFHRTVTAWKQQAEGEIAKARVAAKESAKRIELALDRELE